MKKLMTRGLALAACGALMLSLAACGNSAAGSEPAPAESEPETGAPAEIEEETDPYALQAADFDYSEALDNNGYFKGVKALDLVTLPADYMNIVIPNEFATVTEEELQDTIDELLAQYPSTETDTTSAVAEGDLVNIDYVGSVDGVEFTGGSTHGMGTDVTAGSSQYVDDFLTQIIGHKPGETFDVFVTFPEGYSDGQDADGNTVVLANQEAKFVVTINHISRENPAEWNDDFVAQYIDPAYGTTVAEFTETLYNDMSESKRSSYVQDYLFENTTFPDTLPQDILDYNLMTVLKYYSDYGASYGMNLSQLMQAMMQCTVQEYVEQSQASLAEITRQTLLVQAICEDNDLAPSDDIVLDAFPDEETKNRYLDDYGMNYLKLNYNSNNALDFVVQNSFVSK